MREALLEQCESFIENRNTVKSTFKIALCLLEFFKSFLRRLSFSTCYGISIVIGLR